MDITSWVIELEEARWTMQAAKKRIKSEVEREYKKRAAVEIADKTADSEVEFARKLKNAVAAGVPQSVIRSKVLRTNAWDRWVYWRDLAEIEPERISTRKAREAASEWFRWEGDTLVLFKNDTGKTLEPEVELSGPWMLQANDSYVPKVIRVGELEIGPALEYITDNFTGTWADVFLSLTDTVKNREGVNHE